MHANADVEVVHNATAARLGDIDIVWHSLFPTRSCIHTFGCTYDGKCMKNVWHEKTNFENLAKQMIVQVYEYEEFEDAPGLDLSKALWYAIQSDLLFLQSRTTSDQVSFQKYGVRKKYANCKPTLRVADALANQTFFQRVCNTMCRTECGSIFVNVTVEQLLDALNNPADRQCLRCIMVPWYNPDHDSPNSFKLIVTQRGIEAVTEENKVNHLVMNKLRSYGAQDDVFVLIKFLTTSSARVTKSTSHVISFANSVDVKKSDYNINCNLAVINNFGVFTYYNRNKNNPDAALVMCKATYVNNRVRTESTANAAFTPRIPTDWQDAVDTALNVTLDVLVVANNVNNANDQLGNAVNQPGAAPAPVVQPGVDNQPGAAPAQFDQPGNVVNQPAAAPVPVVQPGDQPVISMTSSFFQQLEDMHLQIAGILSDNDDTICSNLQVLKNTTKYNTVVTKVSKLIKTSCGNLELPTRNDALPADERFLYTTARCLHNSSLSGINLYRKICQVVYNLIKDKLNTYISQAKLLGAWSKWPPCQGSVYSKSPNERDTLDLVVNRIKYLDRIARTFNRWAWPWSGDLLDLYCRVTTELGDELTISEFSDIDHLVSRQLDQENPEYKTYTDAVATFRQCAEVKTLEKMYNVKNKTGHAAALGNLTTSVGGIERIFAEPELASRLRGLVLAVFDQEIQSVEQLKHNTYYKKYYEVLNEMKTQLPESLTADQIPKFTDVLNQLGQASMWKELGQAAGKKYVENVKYFVYCLIAFWIVNPGSWINESWLWECVEWVPTLWNASPDWLKLLGTFAATVLGMAGALYLWNAETTKLQKHIASIHKSVPTNRFSFASATSDYDQTMSALRVIVKNTMYEEPFDKQNLYKLCRDVCAVALENKQTAYYVFVTSSNWYETGYWVAGQPNGPYKHHKLIYVQQQSNLYMVTSVTGENTPLQNVARFVFFWFNRLFYAAVALAPHNLHGYATTILSAILARLFIYVGQTAGSAVGQIVSVMSGALQSVSSLISDAWQSNSNITSDHAPGPPGPLDQSESPAPYEYFATMESAAERCLSDYTFSTPMTFFVMVVLTLIYLALRYFRFNLTNWFPLCSAAVLYMKQKGTVVPGVSLAVIGSFFDSVKPQTDSNFRNLKPCSERETIIVGEENTAGCVTMSDFYC